MLDNTEESHVYLYKFIMLIFSGDMSLYDVCCV